MDTINKSSISQALNLPILVARLHRAQTVFPASIQGQQDHFGKTLPCAEAHLAETLNYLFSSGERQTLREALGVEW